MTDEEKDAEIEDLRRRIDELSRQPHELFPRDYLRLVDEAQDLRQAHSNLFARCSRLEAETRGSRIVLGILIKRLGGEVKITSREITEFSNKAVIHSVTDGHVTCYSVKDAE